MKSELFSKQLAYILEWWDEFVDWENGGIFTQLNYYNKERYSDSKAPLMHLRQMYKRGMHFTQLDTTC